MTEKKKSKPNAIEAAIGNRAKTKDDLKETAKTQETDLPKQIQIPDEPTPSEQLTLEELNRQTEERLQEYAERYLTQEEKRLRIPQIPVSKPDPQPVTKNSSLESPPQVTLDSVIDSRKRQGKINEKLLPLRKNENVIGELDALVKQEIPDAGDVMKNTSAEDVELTALRKYILEDGFVLATVSFHIVTLCAQPMVTPSTTTWDFKDRASIPDMVLALLNQPGYIEGIWPSLRVVMGSNIGNAAWCAGICTTIAFFDVIRTLPMLKELQQENVDK